MVVLARMIGLIVGAVAVQIAHGIGLVALVLALWMGWRGMGLLWLAVLILVFTGVAHVVFADAEGAGKIANALSNVVFEVILYAVIGGGGYAAGALARYLRRRA